MKLHELSDNSWDIGMVSGVLQGIALTPSLLPNQKEAIADARKAIERIQTRNQKEIVAITNPLTEASNDQAQRPERK